MKKALYVLAALTMVACDRPVQEKAAPKISPDKIRSGYAFLTADTQALQDDQFANPGYLWVDRGAAMFRSEENGPACATCHDEGLTGVAAHYPAYDQTLQTVLNLEGRINQCRTEYQQQAPLPYESDELLSLTAYVANQSIGVPVSVEISEGSKAAYEVGKAYFETRRGQLNLSCQQCHTENWSKQLRGDTISQGHGNGFPAYRLEWQSLGSLQRRLRDCDTGVRAEPLPYGDKTYIALELYLAARAQGLDIETPAVRR